MLSYYYTHTYYTIPYTYNTIHSIPSCCVWLLFLIHDYRYPPWHAWLILAFPLWRWLRMRDRWIDGKEGKFNTTSRLRRCSRRCFQQQIECISKPRGRREEEEGTGLGATEALLLSSSAALATAAGNALSTILTSSFDVSVEWPARSQCSFQFFSSSKHICEQK